MSNPLRAYPPGILGRDVQRLSLAPSMAEAAFTAYPDPIPTRSLEEWWRWTHVDLEEMTLEELDRERVQATMRLTYASDRETRWFRDRRAKLDAYAERRRSTGR